MDEPLTRQSAWLEQPAKIFFLFTVLIFLIRIFLRSQVLELDEAEQVVMAQQWLLGYPNQPPLYTWLQFGFFKLFGVHLLSLALLKSALLFGCLYCFHQISRLHCADNRLAWCASFSWVLILALSHDLIRDNTHSVLALFAACLTWYWFIAPSKLSNLSWYLLFGCIMGLGFLSKFNYLLFFIILMGSACSLESCRSKVLHRGMVLSLLVALSLSFPYLFWIYQHSDFALQNASKLVPARKQQWEGVIELAKASLFFACPVLIISFLFFPLKLNRQQAPQKPENRLLLRYHILYLPFLSLFILIAGLHNFETRWLIPLLFLSPLLIFSQIKASESLALRANHFMWFCLMIQFILFLTVIARGYNLDKPRNQFPLTQLVELLKKEAQVDYILADSYWILGNLLTQLPLKAAVLVTTEKLELPAGKIAIIWQSNPPPLWIEGISKDYSLDKVRMLANPQSPSSSAGRAYLSEFNTSH